MENPAAQSGKWRKYLGPALGVGVLGAVLGMWNGFMMAVEQRPPATIPFFTPAPYQNFALAVGGTVGMAVGALAWLFFLRQARRQGYLRLSRLGVRLGFVAAAAIALLACSVVYAAATVFKLEPIGNGPFLVETAVYALTNGVAGLTAGAIAVAAWGHHLSYWD